LKYYNIMFESSSGIYGVNEGYYAISKDNKKKINIDQNRNLLVTKPEVQYYLDNYDIYKVEYAGRTGEEKTR